MRDLRAIPLSGIAARALMSEAPDAAPAGGAPEPDPAPAPEPEPDPAPEPAAEAAPEADPPAEPDPKPAARQAWWDKRIAKLTAENKAKDELIASLKKPAEPPAEGGPAPDAPLQYMTADGKRLYTEDEIGALAAQRSTIQGLNQKCDALYEDGKKDFGEAYERQIQQMGTAFGAEMARRIDFWEAVTDLPNGPAIMNALSGDLERLEAVLELPPHKLGLELAKLSGELAKPKPKPISEAAAPIQPIDGNAGGGEPTLETASSQAEYEAIRAKQREARYAKS